MTLPHPDDVTHVVYTTMQPDTRLEVSERERDELAAQGLIAREEDRPVVENRATPAKPKPPSTT